ncbi:MAG: hypothetical protein CMC55_08660 [Flavobacteriaceae bacterium]|nr:hypothetical protein [Flavobacteriaceae bacterium]
MELSVEVAAGDRCHFCDYRRVSHSEEFMIIKSNTYNNTNFNSFITPFKARKTLSISRFCPSCFKQFKDDSNAFILKLQLGIL